MNFYYRPNAEKINDQFFQKLQKTLCLTHFGQFWGKKTCFLTNWALSHTTSYRFLTLFQSLEKLIVQFQVVQTDRRMERRTGRHYFTLPATAGGLIILKF